MKTHDVREPEMNTSFYMALLTVFTAIAAFLLYRNIISPPTFEETPSHEEGIAAEEASAPEESH